MLKRKWLKWLSISLLFLALIGGGVWLYTEHDKKQRLIAAEAKWERVMEKAASMGIHTDLGSYLAASSNEAPRLLDDFPFINELIDAQYGKNKKPLPFEIDHIKGLKKFPSLSSEMTQKEIIEALRNSLTTPPPSQASNKEVYQTVLSALAPINADLDKWKSAIFEAKSMNITRHEEEILFIPAGVFRNAANLLSLRWFCAWQLGDNNTDDIEVLQKSSHLLKEHNTTIIALSVAIAVDLIINDTLQLATRTINNEIGEELKLLPFYQSLDSIPLFKQVLMTEYVYQLHLLQDPNQFAPMMYDFDYDEEEGLTLNEKAPPIFPPHIVAELKADVAEFQLDRYFGKHDVLKQLESLESINDSDSLLKSYNYRKHSYSVLSVLQIGMGYYFDSALKASMHLDESKLQSACILYKRKHSEYPNQLSDLVPEYLTELPTIPITYKPYGYQKPDTLNDLPIISATIPLPDRDDIIIPDPNQN